MTDECRAEFIPILGAAALTYENHLVETIISLTLVLLLASRMRLAEIKKHPSRPWRLLLVAVPLTAAFGAGVGVILFGGLSV